MYSKCILFAMQEIGSRKILFPINELFVQRPQGNYSMPDCFLALTQL